MHFAYLTIDKYTTQFATVATSFYNLVSNCCDGRTFVDKCCSTWVVICVVVVAKYAFDISMRPQSDVDFCYRHIMCPFSGLLLSNV
jgi:hypothetical protein